MGTKILGSQNLCHRSFHPVFNETTRPKKISWIDLKMVRKKLKKLELSLKNKMNTAGVDEVGRGSLAGPVLSCCDFKKVSN